MTRSEAGDVVVRMPGRVARGAVAWVATAGFFVVEGVVASAAVGYSYSGQVISALGATSGCGPGPEARCSPWHPLMNLDFGLTGLLVLAGAFGLRDALPAGPGRPAAMAAGVGAVLVGVFPSDVAPVPHLLGAVLFLVGGNVAVLLLGVGLLRAAPRVGFGVLPFGLGATGLLGLLGVLADTAAPGVWERIGAYAALLGFITLGLRTLRTHPRPTRR